jgi:hypothetical protein
VPPLLNVREDVIAVNTGNVGTTRQVVIDDISNPSGQARLLHSEVRDISITIFLGM